MKLIKQFDENDCGAACLAMIASHFGSYLSITKIREIAGTDTQGTSLKGMLEAAKKLCLDAKAVKGNEQIFSRKFPVPLIAHLQYQNGSNHFVVISKINEKCVWIYDPAIGKISYKKNDFLKIWSGYLIIVSPTPDFVVQKDISIIDYLKNHENPKISKIYIQSFANQIKKLKFEMENYKFQYEAATKLFPQTISKIELKEAENKYNNAKIEFENFFSDNLVKYSEELEYNKSVILEIESNIEKLNLQMNQTVLKATCDGYIEELQIINIGESIISESKIARIIPENNGKLNVYIKVDVQDVAELHVDDEFALSFPKYPSSNFSSIKGRILNVSKDSMLGIEGKPYFLVIGILDNIDFVDKRNKNKIGLVPGMTATARIKVRTEPLYVYLLKQIGL